MPTLETVKLDTGLFSMFKGEWGTRKSTQALSYPTPQYWFSFDRKMGGLLLPMKLWGIKAGDIHFDNYSDWNKAEMKLKQLQANCSFKTIIVDNISSQGDAVNLQTLKTKSGTTRQDGAEAGKRIAGIPVNTIEDFNAESSVFQQCIFYLKDICEYHKVHVILIAHIMRTDEKDPKGNSHVCRTIVTGGKKIAAKIPAYCQEVYHFNIKGDFGEGQYALFTQHNQEDFARTSLPLEKEIIFGDKSLYENWIVPAVKKFESMPSLVRM